MTDQTNRKKFLFLASLLLLNLVPVYGVFHWDWKSFDLIFLYWIENLLIGAFTVLKIIVRPYQSLSQTIATLFPAIFFSFHYGIFCLAHGSFVILLFGNNLQHKAEFGEVLTSILPIINERQLGWAIIALAIYQLLDWLRDVKARGLGAEKPEIIMMSPYKRIMVLHIAIIGSGFLLSELNEPVAGLLMLIALKIVTDIYQWRKENSSLRNIQHTELKKIAGDLPKME
jgi:hypothetical protein